MSSKTKIKAVGYVRISTNEDKQKYGLKVQEEAIKEYCKKEGLDLVNIYRDEKSGKTLNRSGIKELLKNREEFQVVVIYKIDRLSRSVLDLLKIVREKLDGKEVVFVKEGIDQRTKEGRLLFNQLASFAEYERELIVSRIKDGLDEARKQGVKLGAKPKYHKYSERVKKLREDLGLTWDEICKELDINFRTAKKAYEEVVLI